MSKKVKRFSLSMLSLVLLSSGFITSCNKGGGDDSSSSSITSSTTLSQWEVTQDEFTAALKEYESFKVPSESRDVKIDYETSSKTGTSKATLILKGKLIGAVSEEAGEDEIIEPTSADYSIGNVYSKVDTEYAIKKDTSLTSVNQVVSVLFTSPFSSTDYSKFTYNSTDKAYTASSLTVTYDLTNFGIDTSKFPTGSKVEIQITNAVLKFDTKKLISYSFNWGGMISQLSGMTGTAATLSYGNNTLTVPSSYNENKIHNSYYIADFTEVGAAIENSNIKFKYNDGTTTSTFTVDGDKWLVEQSDKKYFVKKDVESNILLYVQESGADKWTQIEEEANATEYETVTDYLTLSYNRATEVTNFASYYSSLTYDSESKSYKGPTSGLTIKVDELTNKTYENVEFKFNCSNIVTLSYGIQTVDESLNPKLVTCTVSEYDLTTQTVTDPTVVSINN